MHSFCKNFLSETSRGEWGYLSYEYFFEALVPRVSHKLPHSNCKSRALIVMDISDKFPDCENLRQEAPLSLCKEVEDLGNSGLLIPVNFFEKRYHHGVKPVFLSNSYKAYYG